MSNSLRETDPMTVAMNKVCDYLIECEKDNCIPMTSVIHGFYEQAIPTASSSSLRYELLAYIDRETANPVTEVAGNAKGFEMALEAVRHLIQTHTVSPTPSPSLREIAIGLCAPWDTRGTWLISRDPDYFDITDCNGECVAEAVQGSTAQAIVSIINSLAEEENTP